MSQSSSSLAFVFPGQGSQTLGMLADLAQAHSEVHASFDEASQGVGTDLWALSQNGPQDELDRTENTQPALLAAGVAVWRAWEKAGGEQPARMAGHSLGEYSALVCSGALSLYDAANLVAERGRLMQTAVPRGTGAMAAVLGAEDEQVAAVCEEVAQGQVVAPANYNAPGQIVIAGHAEAVARASGRLQELGARKVVKLAVSVPSHCELMREASAQLAERMSTLSWSVPRVPVIQNVEAKAYGSVEYIRAALERQLYMPVRWTECMQTLVAGGATQMAECGPGKVLCGLGRRIDRTVDMRALESPSDFDTALEAWSAAKARDGDSQEPDQGQSDQGQSDQGQS